MRVSEEVRKLDGKEGNLTDLARQYLDAKKANYTVLKAEPGDTVATPKGVEPFVEPGSIMIEKNGKKVIIEELTKVCGLSGRFHDTDEKVRAHAILDRPPRILFKTRKDEKSLYIHTDAEIKDPSFGIYLGGGRISVDMEDILKEPSKIPDINETFEINCKCEERGLKCKGHAWQW
jgi:hypothetical protein